MKTIVLVLLAVFFIQVAKAEPLSHPSTDLQRNLTLLASQCGYMPDKNISARISRSSSNVTEKVAYFNFYIKFVPIQRIVQGKLSFSCFRAASSPSSQNLTPKITASDEIAQEDSGGRYARNIVWQRRYEGMGWTGTIAYVNTVSGDQEARSTSDYFLVCPNRDGLACFSLEIEKARLGSKESDRIPELLHGIMLVGSPLTASDGE